mmetsp:Transcript_34541/g.101507  ORF Transcript_34541/g.101507 Transcript_34541/m.101507 type:complete len:291 (+) Transcript_34541:1454-2326(+)
MAMAVPTLHGLLQLLQPPAVRRSEGRRVEHDLGRRPPEVEGAQQRWPMAAVAVGSVCCGALLGAEPRQLPLIVPPIEVVAVRQAVTAARGTIGTARATTTADASSSIRKGDQVAPDDPPEVVDGQGGEVPLVLSVDRSEVVPFHNERHHGGVGSQPVGKGVVDGFLHVGFEEAHPGGGVDVHGRRGVMLRGDHGKGRFEGREEVGAGRFRGLGRQSRADLGTLLDLDGVVWQLLRLWLLPGGGGEGVHVQPRPGRPGVAQDHVRRRSRGGCSRFGRNYFGTHLMYVRRWL